MSYMKHTSLLLFALIFLTPIVSASPSTRDALLAHNQIRAKDHQRPLKWSKDLENISQTWAEKLASSCQVYHHRGQLPFGENLFFSSNASSITRAVNAWAAEKKTYNYKQNKCQPGRQCGHYTQIVWKGTTEVGCGTKQCANGSQIWVCSYFPAGNIVGARPF